MYSWEVPGILKGCFRGQYSRLKKSQQFPGILGHQRRLLQITENFWENPRNLKNSPIPENSRVSFRTQDIASFLDVFLTTTKSIRPEAWQSVVDIFMKNCDSVKTKVKVQYLAQQHVISLTGKRQEVEALVEELQELSTKIERKVTLEASKKTTFIENISQMRLKFLRDLDFEKELESQHEETQVSILLEKGKIQIRAPSNTTDKVSSVVREALANMKELSLKVSQNAVELLRSRACQAFMKDHFTAKTYRLP